MFVAPYLRNHYGQVGIAAAAVYTSVYTGLANKAQSYASSYMYKTVDCVLHKDKDFKAICDNVNNQSKMIWDGMHTDHKTAMLGRNQLVPIEMSSDVIKTSNAVTQWVQEAASCNKLLFICDSKKTICDNELPAAKANASEVKTQIINLQKEHKVETDPLIERKGECKELESLKDEIDRLRLVEKDHIKLDADYKNLEKLYNSLTTDHSTLKTDHKAALKKCGSWCV